ncbi:MAG: FAD binding domain-containing protein [Desulfuromonadaceae bacterium]|nr:FAD binding domain-containing protein [Desulfuromonadaceae bacterium]
MRSFSHLNARTVSEAIAALVQFDGRARLNAGGTELFGALKDEFLPEYPEAVINIKSIKGLEYIKEEKGHLRIGALTKLSVLSESRLLRERYGALAEAAHAVAGPQIRNVATIGGNLCQDVRCCYYRYPRHIGGPINCARKGNGPCLAVNGDNRNHAIFAGRKCFAVCPSDTAVALALYDAQLVVVGPQGERQIAVRDFYTPIENLLQRTEIVREILIPAVTGTVTQSFSKFALRTPIDFAIVSVASLITLEDGICTDARIVLGAVAHNPHRALEAEEFLRGCRLDVEVSRQAGEFAIREAKPLSKNAFKIQIAKTLVSRAIFGQPAGFVLKGNFSETTSSTQMCSGKH